MLREALNFLIQKGVEENPIVETEYGTFSKMQLSRIKLPNVSTLEVSTLTSLIDFLKNDVDGMADDDSYLIHIVTPNTVKLLLPLGEDGTRQCVLTAITYLPGNIHYGRFIDTEQFNIMLQSSFVDIGDRALLLKFTGLIKDEKVKQTGDNGVSQSVTIKTGVATVSDAEVPNPVMLAPYRTFAEIEQVESPFIFRMQDGPVAALHEADGGAWRNKTMLRIRHFIEESLEGCNVKYDIVS